MVMEVEVSAADTSAGPKFNKFRVSKKEDRTVDDVVFDSKLEANVYRYLKQEGLQFDMQVKFELQPKFELQGAKFRAVTYVADFVIHHNGQEFVLDAKGMKTPDYELKKKWFAYVHHRLITEVRSVKQAKEFVFRLRQALAGAALTKSVLPGVHVDLPLA